MFLSCFVLFGFGGLEWGVLGFSCLVVVVVVFCLFVYNTGFSKSLWNSNCVVIGIFN